MITTIQWTEFCYVTCCPYCSQTLISSKAYEGETECAKCLESFNVAPIMEDDLKEGK